MEQENKSIEVLNPRGVINAPAPEGLKNPRIDSLDGKRIALLSEKPDAEIFFDVLEEILNEKYPTTTILRFPSTSSPMIPDNTKEVAQSCDAWVEGIKTTGSSKQDAGIKLEREGAPGVAITIDDQLPQRKRLAETNGLPTVRIVTVPAEKFFTFEGSHEKVKPIVVGALDSIVSALITPLTEAEKNPVARSYDYGPMTFTADGCTEANEKFQQYCIDNEMSDGLPVIPPTRDAVEWMLGGTTRSRDEVLGLMTPFDGAATIEKVAINAVMAGAKPEYLPVIIAAVEVIVDRSFNLYHITTGTLCSRPLIWVNGPITKEIGMNSGAGFLGPGNRANSTIGRAVSLCMINIGWSSFKTECGMQGQPTRYCGLIFAENEEESPWESFAVEHGFGPEDSTVTIDECMSDERGGPGGGMGVIPLEDDLARLVQMVKGVGQRFLPEAVGPKHVSAAFSTWGVVEMVNNLYCNLALHPSFARQLADAGFTKQSLAKWLCDKQRYPWEQYSGRQQEMILNAAKSGLVYGLCEDDCKPGGTIPSFNPKHLSILVAGSMAGQAMSFNCWGAAVVNSDNVGAPQYDYVTKKIHGAALTIAGK